jgi:hypothetical protein
MNLFFSCETYKQIIKYTIIERTLYSQTLLKKTSIEHVLQYYYKTTSILTKIPKQMCDVGIRILYKCYKYKKGTNNKVCE